MPVTAGLTRVLKIIALIMLASLAQPTRAHGLQTSSSNASSGNLCPDQIATAVAYLDTPGNFSSLHYLIRHGDESAVREALVKATIDGENEIVQVRAHFGLFRLRVDADIHWSVLMEALRSVRKSRYSAIKVLHWGLQSEADSEYAPSLIDLAHSNDFELRSFAILLLGRFSGVEGSLETILNSGNDWNPRVRTATADSLREAVRIDESLVDDEQVITCISQLINDDAHCVREAACETARWIRSADEIPVILQHLLENDSVDTVRSKAARSLIYVSDIDSRRDILEIALEDPSGLVRSSALQAFTETTPDGAVSVLIGVLESANTLDHRAAMELLEGVSLGRAWLYRIGLHWPELVILLIITVVASIMSSRLLRWKGMEPDSNNA